MSPVLVGIGLWFSGLISGALLFSSDKKCDAKSATAFVFVPLLTVGAFLLAVALILEIAPLISLEATAQWIVGQFTK